MRRNDRHTLSVAVVQRQLDCGRDQVAFGVGQQRLSAQQVLPVFDDVNRRSVTCEHTALQRGHPTIGQLDQVPIDLDA